MKKFPIAIRSMTAYGEASSEAALCHCCVIIQSVNRRFLEISLNLPTAYASFEAELRKWVGTFVARGQVSVTISIKPGTEKVRVVPNLTLAKEIKKGWDLIAKELNLSYDFSLSLLSQEKDLFIHEEIKEESSLLLLEKTVIAALEKHRVMREAEGRALKSDIDDRLTLIKHEMQKIDLLKEEVVILNREKMTKRIAELFEKDVEERILKEVALLAEKVDITEEIVRFHSLLIEFEKTLSKPLENNDSKGKKLEFLLQELSREINTIGSKAMNVDVVKHVVCIKSELEKIREQVQNIE